MPTDHLEAPSPSPSSPFCIRLPPALVDRVDRLWQWMMTDPVVSASGALTRSHALRAALTIGLEELERRRATGADTIERPRLAGER